MCKNNYCNSCTNMNVIGRRQKSSVQQFLNDINQVRGFESTREFYS